jgi:DNA-binding NarL/FixJ family response regulator
MSAERRARVVVAEDDFLVREGIRRTLEHLDGVDLVGAAGDLQELRATVERADPDVVVTDIRLPPTLTDEGIRFAKELRERNARTAVIVLSMHADASYALALFEHGASGRAYLLKERIADRAQLERVLWAVAAGESYVDTRVVERILSASERRREESLNPLTPREREVLALIAEGLSNRAVAGQLSITTRAVERHVNSIFAKLGIAESESLNRRVLAVLAFLASGEADSRPPSPRAAH